MRKAAIKTAAVLLLFALVVGCFSGCSKLRVGGSIEMGNDDGETLRWDVIAVDGDRALVVARESVDWRLFNDSYASVTWENSSVRNWLNDTFYYYVFTPEERARIIETEIENPDNPDSGVDGGGKTTDRLFLLSYYEVRDYLGSGSRRTAWKSVRAHNSAQQLNPDGYIGSFEARYWTRTPGDDSRSFLCVDEDGDFVSWPTGRASDRPENQGGIQVKDDKNGGGVRPAMWIKR